MATSLSSSARSGFGASDDSLSSCLQLGPSSVDGETTSLPPLPQSGTSIGKVAISLPLTSQSGLADVEGVAPGLPVSSKEKVEPEMQGDAF